MPQRDTENVFIYETYHRLNISWYYILLFAKPSFYYYIYSGTQED